MSSKVTCSITLLGLLTDMFVCIVQNDKYLHKGFSLFLAYDRHIRPLKDAGFVAE